MTGSYDYSDGTKDTDKFIDIVVLNGQVYYCSLSYRSSSPSVTDGHWTQGSNFDLVATKLLLAENATIKMANSQQINIIDGNTLWGSFRYASSNDDYALWIGASNGASAPFSVKRSGFTKMTDADITGKITATSGSIAGFSIYKNSLGSVGQSEGMGLSSEYLKFMNLSYLHGGGYFITCGSYLDTGLRIDSTTSESNDVSTGILVNITAGTVTPSDPVSGGKMCTALDLRTRWADQAGSFDMTNPYEGNHAIVIRGGDVIGLRPSFVRLAANYQTLTEYHHTVECYNTSAITIYLPSSPKYGQCYTIIQRGSRVTFSSGKGIYDARIASSATTWYSDTRGQVSWLLYNGSQWIVCYSTN